MYCPYSSVVRAPACGAGGPMFESWWGRYTIDAGIEYKMAIAQQLEHLLREQKVVGSNPTSSLSTRVTQR